MPNVMDTDKYRYTRTKFVGADGKTKHSASNGDAVARAMALLSEEQVADVAAANDLNLGKYKNAGLAKMALANRIRALVKKGTAVQVGDVLVRKLDQKQPELKAPKVEKKDAAKGAGKRAKRNGNTEEVQDEAE